MVGILFWILCVFLCDSHVTFAHRIQHRTQLQNYSSQRGNSSHIDRRHFGTDVSEMQVLKPLEMLASLLLDWAPLPRVPSVRFHHLSTRDGRHGQIPARWAYGSRRDCLSAVGVAMIPCFIFTSLISPSVVKAESFDSALSLASVLQTREVLTRIDAILTEDLIRDGKIMKIDGISSAVGKECRGMVEKLLKTDPRAVVESLASVGRKDGVLRPQEAEAVRECGKRGVEYLAGILENWESSERTYSRDLMDNELPFLQPRWVEFMHKSLVAARDEFDAIFLAFGVDERKIAVDLAVKSYKLDGGPVLQTLPGMPGYEVVHDREKDVILAIRNLPKPIGNFKQDIMEIRNEEVERESRGNAESKL